MKRSGEYRNCLHCSKEFYCAPAVVKNPKRGKYCSNACQKLWMQARGIKPKSKPPKPRHCKGCGVDFTGSGKVYCSEECKSKTKYAFSIHRKKLKKIGITQFKWHELCIICHKPNQVYYVSCVSKSCKKCHNKRVHKNRTNIKNYSNHRSKMNLWKNNKMRKDPAYKVQQNIRARVSGMIKGVKTYRIGSIENMFGCSRDHLIDHIESKFTAKMTWENYGSYWHLDHIIPISSFDLTDPKQCKQANHWTNLQPLEAAANIAKSNTMTKPQMSLMLNI
jgi:hypothetical protein